MAFREIQAFVSGLNTAFRKPPEPIHRGSAVQADNTTRRLTRPVSPSTGRLRARAAARVLGRAVGFLALLILIWAAVVIATGAESGRVLKGVLGIGDASGLSGSAGARDLPAQIEWDAGVPERDWTAIVLHHSATEGGSTASFDTYHRQQKGWQSLGYHFVIGNGSGMADGAIEAGPRWLQQEVGAHANSGEYNRHGIGICLVGNFEHASPTPAQLESARSLVVALARRFRISPTRVLGHCDIREGGTLCPGRNFPIAEFRQAVAVELEGGASRSIRSAE